jgi:hypothetical protein
MNRIKPHEYDPEHWDDEESPEMFQPLTKKGGKTLTAKDERRQRDKEWGRALDKFHKQRTRSGKP